MIQPGYFFSMFLIFANVVARIPKIVFSCLFSVCNIISLSCHKQVCLMKLHFERYFPHHRAYDGRSISWNVVSLSILVHDIINLLYCSVACVLVFLYISSYIKKLSIEVVARRYCVEKLFLNFPKINRKTSIPDSLF